MAYYAYRDEDRINEVLAEEVDDDNKLDEYFCPTPHCTARMSIRSIGGEKAAHFATKKSTSHSDFCRLRTNQINPTQYDEEQFNIENFMNNLLQGQDYVGGGGENRNEEREGDGKIKPISTVRQLYSICIQKSINQYYNEVRIADLLVDTRTRHIYFIYIRGFHLVECQFWRYVGGNNVYYARYWLDDDNNNYLKIKLECQNNQIFDQVYNRVFQRRFVVAGNWRTENHECVVTISNRKQIYPLEE